LRTKTINKVERLLKSFPRSRPPLSLKEQEIFQAEYISSRTGSSLIQLLAQKTEAWMHKQVGKLPAKTILEIGAGTLNQIPYEDSEATYDIIEPLKFLYENQPDLKRINQVYDTIDDVPSSSRYFKIVSIAALEHILDLPRVIARAGLMLEKGGVFANGIPSEGGFLWGLSWRVTTGLAYRIRTGLPYKNIMRHEHINNAIEIILLIKYFFEDVKIKKMPFPHLHTSLFIFIEAKSPSLQRCRDYLVGTGAGYA